MKQMFKYLTIALLVFAMSLKADVVTGTYNTGGKFLVRAGGAVVSTITITTTNAAGTLLLFFDTLNTNATAVVLARTNRVVYTTNLVNNYTTTTGVTNFFTNTVQISRNQALPQQTNELPAVLAYFVPANVPQTFDANAIFGTGIVVTNSTAGASVIVNYRRP